MEEEMKKITKAEMLTLIDELRNHAPRRSLTYGESMKVARLQAAHLRKRLSAKPDADLIWLVEQTAVPVHFVPSHELNEDSGLTTDLVNGKLEIFINENEPQVRQRFSLLHELKHVLDFPHAPTLHGRLGVGDERLKGNMVEWIANEFAGQVLMPTALVKRIWSKSQNLSLAAAVFNVSHEAMRTRLERLNLIGDRKPRPRGYFRSVGLIFTESDVSEVIACLN
jgi:Zn-dependent peptidase ImmA (M78 family)